MKTKRLGGEHPTFAQLAIGQLFKWQSNLGAADLMRKVSETELKNISTGNTYAPNRRDHYFGPDDKVCVHVLHTLAK